MGLVHSGQQDHDGMNSAVSRVAPGPIGYFVLSWVAPDSLPELLAWLTGGHVDEVLSQPGMLAADVTVLEEASSDGRIGVMCSYRVSSLEAYEAYQASDAKARFNAEGRRFEGKMSTTRWHGRIVLDSSAR